MQPNPSDRADTRINTGGPGGDAGQRTVSALAAWIVYNAAVDEDFARRLAGALSSDDAAGGALNLGLSPADYALALEMALVAGRLLREVGSLHHAGQERGLVEDHGSSELPDAMWRRVREALDLIGTTPPSIATKPEPRADHTINDAGYEWL